MYFDNAATTYPKPACVRQAVAEAFLRYGGNPGRGGHRLSMDAAEQLWRCREAAAELFGLSHPERVIFTLNCTMSLNLAIKGILKNGGHLLVSDLEHNAAMRPLAGLCCQGRHAYTVVPTVAGDDDATVASFERHITPTTRAILCLHCSNVFGVALPIRRLGALARRRGLAMIVDGAQSAGILPLHMERDNVDFLCLPGHKGLYGPMGTGLLLCGDRYALPPLIEGGTGSASLSLQQPTDFPERLESGTPNVVGICGLRAGMEWVAQQTPEKIAAHEYAQLLPLYRTLAAHPRARLYTPLPTAAWGAPVLSFTLDGEDPERTAERLTTQGVAVRAGLHCAPLAHRKFGTLPAGTVRLSPSAFTREEETVALCRLLEQL